MLAPIFTPMNGNKKGIVNKNIISDVNNIMCHSFLLNSDFYAMTLKVGYIKICINNTYNILHDAQYTRGSLYVIRTRQFRIAMYFNIFWQ